MGELSEREQRLWDQIEAGLAKEGGVFRKKCEERQLSPWQQWREAPAWIRGISYSTGVVALGAIVALGFGIKNATRTNEQRVDALSEGVDFALLNPSILAMTGVCAKALRGRADEVDAIVAARNTVRRDMYGDGPTGDQLRQAAALAEEHDVPCTPTAADGAYTMTVNDIPVTIQRNDILWQRPSPD